jgi:hypothetical protein
MLLPLGVLQGLLVATAVSGEQLLFTPPRAVLQLTIEIEKGKETLASAVLVHREDGPRGVVLFFLTSETLMPATAGALPGWEHEGEGASRRDGSTLGIAVIRILIEKSSLPPAAVVLEPPREGEPFFVVIHNAAGQPVVVPQHAQKVSARSAMGDIDISSAAGCVGAPAFTERGVFGIVTECGAGQPPLITLLSSARDLLRRLIPGLPLGPRGSLTTGIAH